MRQQYKTAIENKALVLDLVEWIACGPHPYADVLDAWRTSCPRFPIFEDAIDHGFIAHAHQAGSGPMIAITPAGEAFLRAELA